MKVLAMYAKETTLGHYSKGGVTLHGALVVFFDYDPVSQTVVRKYVHLNSIVLRENQQGTDEVLATNEAIFYELSQHLHLKHIKKVSIRSDNAGCYRNLLILLGVGLLNGVCGITVKRMIKFPVQRGKSLLDAHFGRVMDAFFSDVQLDFESPTNAAMTVETFEYSGHASSKVRIDLSQKTCLQLERSVSTPSSPTEAADSVDSVERQDVVAYAVRRMVELMGQSGDLLMRATTSTEIDFRDDAHNDEDTIEQACETISVDNATPIASNDSQAMVSLRDGRSDTPEYVLAEHHILPAKSQGWARRPHHGSTYGSDYMGPYR
ncbi:Hypothetical Protein FCC1311_113582, partial [Hondaea fermentalgiana]